MRRGVGRLNAGDDLDQSRFARAVVADERDDFACVDLEVEFLDRDHAAEILVDVLQREDGVGAVRAKASLIAASPLGRPKASWMASTAGRRARARRRRRHRRV